MTTYSIRLFVCLKLNLKELRISIRNQKQKSHLFFPLGRILFKEYIFLYTTCGFGTVHREIYLAETVYMSTGSTYGVSFAIFFSVALFAILSFTLIFCMRENNDDCEEIHFGKVRKRMKFAASLSACGNPLTYIK